MCFRIQTGSSESPLSTCSSPSTPSANFDAVSTNWDSRALRIAPWLWDLPPEDRRYYPLYAECVELSIPFSLRVEGFLHAVDATAPEGTLHSASYYAAPMPLPRGKLYTKGIRFFTGRVHSAAALPEILAFLQSGFDPGGITPTVIAWNNSASDYLDHAIKLVVVCDR
jgi:hypothetical protein